jgi:hypothetical protein
MPNTEKPNISPKDPPKAAKALGTSYTGLSLLSSTTKL